MRTQWTEGVSSIFCACAVAELVALGSIDIVRIGSPVMKRDSSRHKESRTTGLAPRCWQRSVTMAD